MILLISAEAGCRGDWEKAGWQAFGQLPILQGGDDLLTSRTMICLQHLLDLAESPNLRADLLWQCTFNLEMSRLITKGQTSGSHSIKNCIPDILINEFSVHNG